MGPGFGADVAVDSDPRGAEIWLNREKTAWRTPSTLHELEDRQYELTVRMDSSGFTYGYTAIVDAGAADSLIEVNGALLLRCSLEACPNLVRYYSGAGIRYATSPTGSMLHVAGQGEGLFWPDSTSNSYVSVASPVFAGIYGGGPVALGPYDESYLAGRPAPRTGTAGGSAFLLETSWILPPADVAPLRTVRGLAIDQEWTTDPAIEGVIRIRLTFRNITNQPSYVAMDRSAANGGITFSMSYIGFAVDADIGTSEDDLVSYVPDLNLVFAYDGDFREGGYSISWSDRPGVIGLRLLDYPEGAAPILNAWPRSSDWRAGSVTSTGVAERLGWEWLRGKPANSLPDHPDPRVGFAPSTANDYRIGVSAGPLQLAPGDSASMTVALIVAPPAAGTFTPGRVVAPGDPADGSRLLVTIAGPLVDKARQLGTP